MTIKKSETKLTIQADSLPSPSTYMKARRPEQYSDSEYVAEIEFDKEYLEYKLASITSRSEEKQFEHFSRKLAEKLICPNLMPQTGPTGGGDAKVDTETYPVHEEISERWYEGNSNADKERWGFAISAKKAWPGKIRSDMASIASTGRGYKVVYFITNQFVRDKTKAKFQDELSNEHGFDVRILDRTWVIEAVVGKKNEYIAVETLGISAAMSKSPRLGPNDLTRTQQLEEIEKQIDDQGRYTGVEYQLVEDCLSAAIVSKELEVPRHETDGRFERAIRIARKYGSPRQVCNALYQKAWAAVFWFDDFDPLLEVYEEVEKFGLKSIESDDVEKVLNLWHCLYTAYAAGAGDCSSSAVQEKADRLLTHLGELSDVADRPNNSANCKALLLSLVIVTNVETPEQQRRSLIVRALVSNLRLPDEIASARRRIAAC